MARDARGAAAGARGFAACALVAGGLTAWLLLGAPGWGNDKAPAFAIPAALVTAFAAGGAWWLRRHPDRPLRVAGLLVAVLAALWWLLGALDASRLLAWLFGQTGT